MNVSVDMLRTGNWGEIDDRLWDNNRNYLGVIHELTDDTITLRNGIHINEFERPI